MELLSSSLLVVTGVEVSKRLHDKDYRAVGVIILAALIGAGAGYLGLAGLNVGSGVIAGLQAVGIHTVAQAAGGK